jgi:hypothetical protein
MNLILNLSPETEAKLLEQAALSGQSPEELAARVLEEQLSDIVDPANTLTPEEWAADIKKCAESHRRLSHDQWQEKFDAFVASIPKTNATFVDDSRESIYEGRGE